MANKASLTGELTIKRPDYLYCPNNRVKVHYSTSTETGKYIFRIAGKEVQPESRLYQTLLNKLNNGN